MIKGKCFRNWFSERFLSWTKEFLAANNIVLVLCDDLKCSQASPSLSQRLKPSCRHEVYLNSNVCAEERGRSPTQSVTRISTLR